MKPDIYIYIITTLDLDVVMVATTEDGVVVVVGVVVHHGAEVVHHGVEVVGHLVPEVVDLGVLVPGLHQVLEEHLVARQQPEKLMNT